MLPSLPALMSALTLAILPAHISAKDLGVQGHCWDIAEADLLSLIEGKLKALEGTETLQNHQEALVEKAQKTAQRPQRVAGITRAYQARRVTYDPTLLLPYDLKDSEGRIFAPAGTRINPLLVRPLTKTLVFIDGDDGDQIAWYQKHHASTSHKLILVGGSPFELQERLGRPCYFDQGGLLSRKFDILQVPTVIKQQGQILIICQHPIQEAGQ